MDESLFAKTVKIENEPLASRMRPETLADFITSESALKKDSYLVSAIENDRISSLILFGPPGCGKTTLANIVARYSKSIYVPLNAAVVTLTVIKEELEKAKKQSDLYGKKTILFIDEMHRLNKISQDALLPYVEKGIVVFIGATTDNPYYCISNALLSRSRVVELHSLSDDNLVKICKSALKNTEKGYGKRNVVIDEKDLELIARSSAGDARIALNILESCVEAAVTAKNGKTVLERKTIENNISRYALLYDKDADYHYDSISAFIKSMRGSDPDAALYYLFSMLDRGEDPLFLFRRMLIFAAEDVGLADPNAITVVVSCKSAFESVGLPEGEYHLSMAALYLSLTHKSSSVSCYFDAKKAAAEKNYSVPLHLRNKGEGAKRYKYPHNFPYHYVSQQYLPDELQGRHFYTPGDLGFEKKLKEIYLYRKSLNEKT